MVVVVVFRVLQAVMEMSQRQKAQQAAHPAPPSGPNGELQFQPGAQNLAQEHEQGEESWGLTFNLVPSALDGGLEGVRCLS